MGFIYQMRVKGKALVYNALKGRAGKMGKMQTMHLVGLSDKEVSTGLVFG